MKKKPLCTLCHRIYTKNISGLCSDCTKEVEEKQFLEKRIETNKNLTHYIWIVFEFNWNKKYAKRFLNFTQINHINRNKTYYLIIYSLNDLLKLSEMLNIFCNLNNLKSHRVNMNISENGPDNKIEIIEKEVK